MKRYTAKIRQDGVVACVVSCADENECEREIQHYAAQYEQDGPIEITRDYKLAKQSPEVDTALQELLEASRELVWDVDVFVDYDAACDVERCQVCGQGFDTNAAVKHQPTCKLARLQKALEPWEGK